MHLSGVLRGGDYGGDKPKVQTLLSALTPTHRPEKCDLCTEKMSTQTPCKAPILKSPCLLCIGPQTQTYGRAAIQSCQHNPFIDSRHPISGHTLKR